MENSEKLREYCNVLSSLELLRNDIVTKCIPQLACTGMLPDKESEELKIVASITGACFDGFGKLGLEIRESEENKDIATIEVDGKVFMCAKAFITEPKSVTFARKSESTSKTVPEEVKHEEKSEARVEVQTPKNERFEEEKEPDVPVKQEEYKNPEPPKEPEVLSSDDDIIDTEPDEPAKKRSFEEYYGDTAEVEVVNYSKDDIFADEKTKDAGDLVYSYSKISVMHQDVGRPEEMCVMIAPLKMSKYAVSSVPIIVSFLYNGKVTTFSSYDEKNDGKNLLIANIGEYYLLCRGYFDDDGNFKSTIVTTGISANQGDKLSVVSAKSFGNSLQGSTRNGHIKFRYSSDSGPGYIEVFPFGEVGEQDFVAIVKNNEFTDYYFMSETIRSVSKPLIFVEGGEQAELVCMWDGSQITAELV